MHSLDYQIVVQWSYANSRYEVYSPTLMIHARKFVPDFPKVAYGDSIIDAISNYQIQSGKLLEILKSLAILPPPPDVGAIDEGVRGVQEKLGKVVL